MITLRRIKIGVVCLLICLMGVCIPKAAVFAASSTTDVYSKQYTIENLLSDYQYVSKSDLTALGHTVGAIACGGTANINSFGDGATSISYINNIKNIGNYAAGDYFSSNSQYAGYVGLPAYYKSASSGVSTNGTTKYTGTGEYINFSSAFADILTESTSITTASNAYTVTEKDIKGDQYNGYTLVLPLAADKNIVIPKSIYDKVNYIKLSGITDINDISTNQYTISVVGVTSKEPISLTFGYISYSDSKSSNTKGILYSDGQSFNNSNSLKSTLSGGIESGQMNMNGTKLIWNFPDAAAITTDYTEGHIVAPSATVTTKSGTGNFEGGIIANEIINSSAEAHFYPYDAVGTKGSTPGGSTSESTSITPKSGDSTDSTPGGPTSESTSITPTSGESTSITPISGDSTGSSSEKISAGNTLKNMSTTVKDSDSTLTQTKDIPETGDSAPLVWPFVLTFTLALISIIGIIYFGRKNRE